MQEVASRRRLLALIAGSTALSGCLDGEDQDDGNETDGGDGDNDSDDDEDGGDEEFTVGEPFEAAISISDEEWPLYSKDEANTGYSDSTSLETPLDVDWQTELRLPVSRSVVVGGEAVFAVDGDDGDGTVYAVDAPSGDVLWNYEHDEEVRASPAVSESTVYAVGRDDVLYAFDVSNGEERWNADVRGATRRSAPTLADDMVYVGSDEGLHAFGAYSGMERFATDSGAVETTPAVVDGVVYYGSDDGSLYAVDAESGEVEWEFETDGSVQSSPAVVDGSVYFGSNDRWFYCVDVDGEEVWSYEVGDRLETSPAVAGGSVYFGSAGGELYGLDAEDGEESWDEPVDAGNWVRDGVAVAGDHVLATRRGGVLLVVEAGSGSVVQEVDLDDLVEDVTVSSPGAPVPVGDHVFVGAGPDLVALR
ncbi:MAG: PQQ-binding-like beta-propeller repeat protein [Halobacteriales archaeon]